MRLQKAHRHYAIVLQLNSVRPSEYILLKTFRTVTEYKHGALIRFIIDILWSNWCYHHLDFWSRIISILFLFSVDLLSVCSLGIVKASTSITVYDTLIYKQLLMYVVFFYALIVMNADINFKMLTKIIYRYWLFNYFDLLCGAQPDSAESLFVYKHNSLGFPGEFWQANKHCLSVTDKR